MAKVKRKKVEISAPHYSFEERYNEEMSFFNDKRVISIHVLNIEEEEEFWRKETYLVFYEETEDED
jgi:hypothetical protein